jgi:RHS repeat-associated protein
MRTTAQGYSAADNVRQRYADTRLDDATGLDHTLWRKLETRSGRWTTPDPYGKSLRVGNPQSFNRYAYVHNDPVNVIDPTGLDPDDFYNDENDPMVIRTNTWGRSSPWLTGGGFLGDDTGILIAEGSTDPPIGGGPQNPTPSQILNTAIESVKKRLKDKIECRDLFDTIDPNSILANNVSIDVRSASGREFTSDFEAARTMWDFVNGERVASGTIVFNQNSWFFIGTMGGRDINVVLTQGVRHINGLGNLDLNGLRDLAVLHELMHIQDVAGTYNDADGGGQANPTLNNLIRAKCF